MIFDFFALSSIASEKCSQIVCWGLKLGWVVHIIWKT